MIYGSIIWNTIMGLSLDENSAHYQIKSYKPGNIQINEQVYSKSLILSPSHLIENWRPQLIADLIQQDFDVIIELSPAILLIGTGATLAFPDIDVYGDLINEGIGVEVMDTRRACHTFMALAAEDRNVVAALIIK
jgi:uncharacterized protein